MAFSSTLRRSASSFAPLSARALRSQRSCHAAIFTALNQTRIVSSEPRLGPFLPSHSCSTDWPNENLTRFLNSVIQGAEETDDGDWVEEAPGGFPFKIEVELGFEAITLSRDYHGEEIKVEVNVHDLGTEEDSGDDEWDDDDDDKANRPRLPLFVSVDKGNGQFIEFYCVIYRDELVIVWLDVKKPEYSNQIACEGRDFEYLDENLQSKEHFTSI